jgi:RecJ-like exonuclease
MKIISKFSVGDTVYLVKDNITHKEVVCPYCEGSGFIQVKDKSLSCCRCYEVGKIEEGYNYETVIEECKISHMNIKTYSDGSHSIECGLNKKIRDTILTGYWIYESENKLFKTIKEAEKEKKKV